MELQALPSRIGQVRRIVSAQLRYWHLDPLIDRAALGVTELLTNVHRHAQPDKLCTVEIELLLDRLTVSVHDHDPRLPRVRDAEPARHLRTRPRHGRGGERELGCAAERRVREGRVVHAADASTPRADGCRLRPPVDETGTPARPLSTRHRRGQRRRPEHAPARSAVAG